MPDEPDRKIDELLKTYAQKRREEAAAPLEMHPATRKLLQDEVSRSRRKDGKRSEGSLNTWTLLWPRLIWGMAIFAVLAMAARMLMPQMGRSPTSSASDLKLTALNDDGPKIVSAKSSSDANEELHRAPRPLPEQTDFALKDTAGLQLTPPVRQKEIAASPAPTDLFKTAPLREGEIDRGFGVLSAGAITDRPGQLDSLQRPFQSPTGALGEGLLDSYAVELGASVSALSQTNVPLFAAAPTARGAAERENLQAETRFYFRNEANSKQTQATEFPKEKPVTVDSLASSKPAAAVSSEQASNVRADKSNFARARFNQMAGGPESRRPSIRAIPAILNTFEMEQNGDRIRILDADGSVYEGQLALSGPQAKKDLAAVSANAELKNGRKFEAQKLAGADAEGQSVSFRASGTNRSLNELVVLNCTLSSASAPGSPSVRQSPSALTINPATPSAPPPPSPVKRGSQSTNPPGRTEAERTQQHLVSPYARVQGAARIGATNQVLIDAIQVAP